MQLLQQELLTQGLCCVTKPILLENTILIQKKEPTIFSTPSSRCKYLRSLVVNIFSDSELQKLSQKYESVVKVISWRAIFPAPAVLATHNAAQQSSFSLTFVGSFDLELGKIHIFIPDLVFISKKF